MKTGDNMKEHPQRLELRERIIDTALNSFATHGIKSITMDDIAAALGISKRTLYEVFSDKETLLMECLLKAQREGDAYVKDVYEKASNVLEVLLKLYQRSIEKFHNTNKKFFEDIKKYPKVYAELMKRRNRDSEETIAFFKLGIQQGYFRDDVNFTIVNLLVREQLDLLDMPKRFSGVDSVSVAKFIIGRRDFACGYFEPCVGWANDWRSRYCCKASRNAVILCWDY